MRVLSFTFYVKGWTCEADWTREFSFLVVDAYGFLLLKRRSSFKKGEWMQAGGIFRVEQVLSVVYEGKFNSFSQYTCGLTDRGDGHVAGIFIEETVQG